MGCSPYFAATGTHPLLPLDITEMTYLQPLPDSILSTTNLIVRRAIALQKCTIDLAKLHSKVFNARCKATIAFKKKHFRTIHDFNFKYRDLVIMRNSQIEYTLDRKMKPRYLGPLVVVLRNKGGAYILCELDGSVLHRPVAAFRLMPYFARKSIEIPENAIDISLKQLREMEQMDMPEENEMTDPEEADEDIGDEE
jgi:hypothetical protein